EVDVILVERALRADELLVEGTEGGTAIAGDVARRVETGAAVALLLHQAQAHDGLEAGNENAALGEVVFVVERDLVKRHRAGLRGQCAPATKRALGTLDSVERYNRGRRASNAKTSSRPSISRRPRRRQGNVLPLATDAFWRTATDQARCGAQLAPHALRTSAQSLAAAGRTAGRALEPAASATAQTPDPANSQPEHPCRWMPTLPAVRARLSPIDSACQVTGANVNAPLSLREARKAAFHGLNVGRRYLA